MVALFAAAGATVHVPARGAVSAPAHALPPVDVTDDPAVTALFASLPPLWASIHIVGGFAMKPFLETSLSDLRAKLDVNLVSAFLCTREAVRNMARESAATAPRGGRIVNVASLAADQPGSQVAPYAIAKRGVVALTEAAAQAGKAAGILVNAVAPLTIDTPANRLSMPGADFATWATPDEIAQVILFLASPHNTLTTGSVVKLPGRGSA